MAINNIIELKICNFNFIKRLRDFIRIKPS